MSDGFSFANLRIPPPEAEPLPAPRTVELPDLSGDNVKVNPKTKAVTVTNDDATVTVYLGGMVQGADSADKMKFYANLADRISEDELGRISNELLTGIQEDEDSRKEWLETRAAGLRLLALKLEDGQSTTTDGSTPVEGMSRYRSQLLIESVVRAHANARNELLPTDGPVKVRVDDPTSSLEEDSDANALERDMNTWLTAVDKSYYPDTDRMLFWVMFHGCGFKKSYHDPIKRRPVSESVDAMDLIVSNAAIDISSAPRVTHRIFMRPSILKRMQITKTYRNVDLGPAEVRTPNSVEQQKEAISGIVQSSFVQNPNQRDHELFECYCELDVAGFEHKGDDGESDGLPVPYKVTIDKASRKILEVRRNWDENDDLCMPLVRFVKFPFIDAIGFYSLGLLHLLGNPTLALTALYRESIDAGMFANFPGFLYAKGAGHQNTNEFRIPPGGGQPIETNGMPIGDAVMKLPYSEPGPGMAAIIQGLEGNGQRLGGTADVQTGEGRADAPVGTTIALLDQATKPESAVHKRLHAAQSFEFELLVERFREDPEAFFRNLKRPAKQWDKDSFLRALENYNLTPQADPNTASRMHRIAKAQAVYQVFMADQESFDKRTVYDYVLGAVDVGSADQFMAKNQGPPPPDPKAMADATKAQAATMSAQADLTEAQTHAAELGFKKQNLDTENANRDADRAADLHKAGLDFVESLVMHGQEKAGEQMMHEQDAINDRIMHGQGMEADAAAQARQHGHEIDKAHLEAALAPQPARVGP